MAVRFFNKTQNVHIVKNYSFWKCLVIVRNVCQKCCHYHNAVDGKQIVKICIEFLKGYYLDCKFNKNK